LLKKQNDEIHRLKSVVTRLSGGGIEGGTGFGSATNEYQIYVGNLSLRTTTDDLREHFKKYGKVTDAYILRKNVNSQCGGVEFELKTSVKEALKVTHDIGGNRIIVAPRHARTRSGREIRFTDKENQAPMRLSSPENKIKTEKKVVKSRFAPY
jgi:RNA recognition motif-containing protein